MKTGDLVKQFGVSDSTIRRWVREFTKFLTESNSKHRSFTSDDFIVMATINHLSNQGYTLDAIRGRLDEGYRIENISTETVGYSDGRMVPAAAVEQIIDSSELRVELEQVKSDKTILTLQLQDARQELVELREKYEQQGRGHKEELETLNNKIQELQHRLGLAEGELLYRRKLDEKE